MIIESLWVLLLGMIGIFIVMGIIGLALSIMNSISRRPKKDDTENPE